MDGLQRIDETLLQIVKTLICDGWAAMGKSKNSSEKSLLPSKVELDGLWGIDCFDMFTKIVKTLICDFDRSVSKSTNLFRKVLYPKKSTSMDCNEFILLRHSPRQLRP